MEQELKEVDGVAGVASETSLSISPSPSFFSFFFFGLLIFATLSTCRRRRNSWRYQRPTQKKKKRIILLSVTANQLGRVDSLPILLGFRAFCSAYFWRENDKKKEERKKKKREQMTRMAVSCRARLYCYFRSKQQGSSWSSGRSTWWITLAPTQPIFFFFFLQWKRRTERWWGRTADQSNVRSKALFFPQC